MTSRSPVEPTVAVVTPTHRQMNAEEQVSMAHLQHFLADYPRFLVLPRSLKIEAEGSEIIHVEDEHFASIEAYGRMLLSPWFYRLFLDYDFILIYQLDCLVFGDDLQAWCRRGFDYIGAPLPILKTDPAKGFSRVGNGGLSLRRVRACLDLITTNEPVLRKMSLIADALRTRLPDLRHLPPAERVVKTMKVLRSIRRGAAAYASRYSCNEDLFWSDRARLFNPRFRIAPLSAGFEFAFELWPRQSLEYTGGRLPFGCHAWSKYDRAFWEQFLVRRSVSAI